MRRPLLALLLILALPATAHATGSSYRLKGKKCKAGYTRQVRHVKGHRQVWCVRRHKAAPPAPTPPTPTHRAETVTIVTAYHNRLGSPYITVWATVKELGLEPVGLPVLLKIEDKTAGNAIVGTFTEPSQNLYGPSCSIGDRLQGGNVVFTGQAVGTDEACALGTVTVPQGHFVEIRGTFGGTEKLAPSSSAASKFYP
jgi:hypothetical protein